MLSSKLWYKRWLYSLIRFLRTINSIVIILILITLLLFNLFHKLTFTLSTFSYYIAYFTFSFKTSNVFTLSKVSVHLYNIINYNDFLNIILLIKALLEFHLSLHSKLYFLIHFNSSSIHASNLFGLMI